MSAQGDTPRGNILVVDDEPLNLRAMEALLSTPDCQVETVTSGAEALRRVLRTDFAVILLDVRMPGMDGFETAALIRKLKRLRHTPILFLTAADDHADWVLRGYGAGAVDYIVKPVDPEVLKAKVAIFLDLNSRSADLATQVEQEQAAQLELAKAKDSLEIEVRERTANLISAHDRLRQEIQQRERAEAELHVAKRVAEEASRAKSEFLASMSHEIRTPLNGIIGLTQVVLDSQLDAEQRECLELVRASGESLLAIVSDVLDISKIEAGRLVVERIPFRLQECVDDAMKPLALAAAGKGVKLCWEIAAQTPQALLGDPMRLRQILVNLAGNAVKFTSQGSVALRVVPESTADGEMCCHFSVADTGIGIPAGLQASIFSPFRQGDASTARRYGGTGLGLSISAQLVELMGGRIWLDSKPGEGSTFHFTLRFGVAEGAALATSRAAAEGPGAEAGGSRPLTVLLVEDNPVNRRLAEIVLTQRGHTVLSVDNGVDAVRTAREQYFDLVLMDVQLPEIDGIAATRAIRIAEESGGRRVPILALTAHALPGIREQCLEAGMDGYLAKPLRPAELLQAVEELGLPVGPQLTVAELRPADAERSALLEETGGDERLLDEICGLFARESAGQMAALRAALVSGDAESFARAAHTLRGMLRSMRAAAAEQLAGTLQPLDPREHREQALEICARLEEQLGLLRERLGIGGGVVADVASERRPVSLQPRF